MNKKDIFTCETCSALYVCLKYFQEHRKKHALNNASIIYPCTHCPQVFDELSQITLHSQTHLKEPPHSCRVCKIEEKPFERISTVEILGTRRSIGTETDDLLDEEDEEDDDDDGAVHHEPMDHHNDVDQVDDDEEDDDEDVDNEEDDDEDDDEDQDDDQQDDEDEDQEDDDDEQENDEDDVMHHPQLLAIPKLSKPSRPSRSTGKGKGNRKARVTLDGDVKRKFACCHCGKSFKTKSHLQRHILTHTGEKPYHCNRCDCRFNQSSSLRNHVIAIHTKEYPHTCNNCQKGFLMPALLLRHLQNSDECKKTNQVVEGL